MNKFAEITVIELLNGTTPETLNSDNDYRTGRITEFVLNKARIVWNDTNGTEYVNRSDLVKFDKETYTYTRPANSDNPSYERQIPPMAIVEQDGTNTIVKPAKRPNALEKSISDMVGNADNVNEIKPKRTTRTKATETK